MYVVIEDVNIRSNWVKGIRALSAPSLQLLCKSEVIPKSNVYLKKKKNTKQPMEKFN